MGSVILILLIWVCAPFVELAVIIVLSEKNRQNKKRINDLERMLQSRQAYQGAPPAVQQQEMQSMTPPAAEKEMQPTASSAMQQGTRPVVLMPSMGQEMRPGMPVPGMGQEVRQGMPMPGMGQEMRPGMPVPGVQQEMRPAMPPNVQRGMPPAVRPPVTVAKSVPHQAPRVNNMGTAALIVGIVLIVLAGLVFGTTTWKILPDPCKVLLIALFAAVFFGASFVAEKKLHIHKTGNGLYILGSIFLFFTVLAAAYFKLLGPMFVLEGVNRCRVLWIGSLVTVGVWFAGLKRFYDRIFTHVSLWGFTVSMMFLAVSFALDVREFVSIMMLYAFFLLAAELAMERVRRRHAQQSSPGQESGAQRAALQEDGIGERETDITWRHVKEMLLDEMAMFVPIHFWLFAGLCAYSGLWEMFAASKGSVFTLAALTAGTAGTALMCAEKKTASLQWVFVLSAQYFLYYVSLAWLFPEKWIYGFLIVQAFTVAAFFVGKRCGERVLLGNYTWGIVCTAFACADGLGVVVLSRFGDIVIGEQLAATAAVILSAAVVYTWRKQYKYIGNATVLIGWYVTVTSYNLVWLFVSDCPDYGVFVTAYVCLVILWNFLAKENCLPAAAAVCVMAMIGFPLSVVPLCALAAVMAAGKIYKREMCGQDVCLCLLFLSAAAGFYRTSKTAEWIGSGGESGYAACILFVVLFAAVYLYFYREKRMWLSCFCVFSMLPLPSLLWYAYGITGDTLYGLVAAALMATGTAARLTVPVVRKEEGEKGIWRIDFYHMLVVFIPLSMLYWADRYWRFAYLLLLGLYCVQYVTVKGFEGCETVRRGAMTLAAGCLLTAFWVEPFVVWPEVIALEINVLAAAFFLFSLSSVWGKSQKLDDIRTPGYVLCLLVPAFDGVLTGRVEDVLLLESVCLLVLIGAKKKGSDRWQYFSAIVMFAFAASIFYKGSDLGVWAIVLLLAAFWVSYLIFYFGQYSGFALHLVSSLAMMPVPMALSRKYDITGDFLYGSVAAAFVATGIAARLFVPIMKKEEGEKGVWRIDFYHMLAVLVPLSMLYRADRYWRFAYVLLIALYWMQYMTVKGFAVENCQKVRRGAMTLAAGCLLADFWIQPFVVWPEMIALEMTVLGAALFLFSLSFVWGKGERLWNIQTAGYVLCLLILALDAAATGEVADALLLGGVCLAALVWAVVKACRRWVRIAGALIVVEALYMTRDFWFNISWWVYLLAAGIGLLVFAAVSEKRKK